MNVCNYCGVELDIEMNYCPLCGHKSNIPVIPVRKEIHQRESREIEKESYDFKGLTKFEKSKLFWELFTIIMGSGVFVSFIIDLFINKQISWSKYPITIGLALFVNVSMIIFMQKRVFLLLSGCFISTSIILLLIDVFNHNLGLGTKLGIPIIFFIYVIVFFLLIFIRKAKQKGINIIAYFLVAGGILGLCIDGIISLHIYNQLKLQWSIILLVSVLPVSAILLFIHYRLKRVTDLKKFFHI